MTDRTNELYFNWLCRIVSLSGRDGNYYRKLFRRLHSIDFRYTIPMDSNRFGDGVNLRYRFGDEYGYHEHYISSVLDTRPCSVFEMMVALALRMEESIMTDPSLGNRTRKWFWVMIDSLNLTPMDDIGYEEDYVLDCVERFLDRKYTPEGDGSLFRILDPALRIDLREVEIWYQALYYLRSVSE